MGPGETTWRVPKQTHVSGSLKRAEIPAEWITTPGTARVQLEGFNTLLFEILPALEILLPEELPFGLVGSRYEAVLSVTGGEPPYTWSVLTGALPPGLMLNMEDGTIEGTPIAPGVFRFGALAEDSAGGTVAKEFRIQVDADPSEPPSLSVRPNRLLFSFVQGAQAETQKLHVVNEGAGSLEFQVEPPPPAEAVYLSVEGLEGDVTAAEPQDVRVTADPTGQPAGTYFTEIQISTPAKEQAIVVPVAMAISARQQLLSLSQTGLRFTAVEGGVSRPNRNVPCGSPVEVSPW